MIKQEFLKMINEHIFLGHVQESGERLLGSDNMIELKELLWKTFRHGYMEALIDTVPAEKKLFKKYLKENLGINYIHALTDIQKIRMELINEVMNEKNS